jgi:hypothetical protein
MATMTWKPEHGAELADLLRRYDESRAGHLLRGLNKGLTWEQIAQESVALFGAVEHEPVAYVKGWFDVVEDAINGVVPKTRTKAGYVARTLQRVEGLGTPEFRAASRHYQSLLQEVNPTIRVGASTRSHLAGERTKTEKPAGEVCPECNMVKPCWC